MVTIGSEWSNVWVCTLQVYDNALIAAGLMVDPRRMLTRLNDLLLKTLNKE